MNTPHRIHLGSAWEPVAAGGGAGIRAVWRRRFGRPSGLDAGTGVWLVIEQPAACAVVLNGHVLPAAAAGAEYRQEVAGLLALRNELLVTPAAATASAGPTTTTGGREPLPAACGSVWLEIIQPSA
jgi:hypothetical protein